MTIIEMIAWLFAVLSVAGAAISWRYALIAVRIEKEMRNR